MTHVTKCSCERMLNQNWSCTFFDVISFILCAICQKKKKKNTDSDNLKKLHIGPDNLPGPITGPPLILYTYEGIFLLAWTSVPCCWLWVRVMFFVLPEESTVPSSPSTYHTFHDTADVVLLRSQLLRWYDKEKRELPWRTLVNVFDDICVIMKMQELFQWAVHETCCYPFISELHVIWRFH